MNDLMSMFAEPDEVAGVVNIAELEHLAKTIVEEEKKEDELKAVYKEQSEKTECLRSRMMELLKKAGKTKYASNVGTFTIAQKTSVRVPADWNEKQKLFDWLEAKGHDTFMTYVTVNSQSLNALYRKELEAAEDKATFKIDGVGEPTVMEEIRFRKS